MAASWAAAHFPGLFKAGRHASQADVPPQSRLTQFCSIQNVTIKSFDGKVWSARMGPREASESRPAREVGSNSRIETPLSYSSRNIHATTFCNVPNTARIPRSHESDQTTAPTSLPALPRRGQPFPFILPHPLGPISPPAGSSPQAEFIVTNTSAPANASILNANFSQIASPMDARRMEPDQSGGLAMPLPTTAAVTNRSRRIGLGNMTGPQLFQPHLSLPHPSENQTHSQHAAYRWQTLATGTHSVSVQEGNAPLFEPPRAEGTRSEKWEMPQDYHKCDECNEGFTTNSWLQQHKTTHLQRFRCGCGAAYIDKTSLLVSLYMITQQDQKSTDIIGRRNTRITRNASKVLSIRKACDLRHASGMGCDKSEAKSCPEGNCDAFECYYPMPCKGLVWRVRQGGWIRSFRHLYFTFTKCS